MSGFPRWKYHAEKPAIIVKSEEEEKSLGHEWVNSPAEKASFPVDQELKTSDDNYAMPLASMDAPKRRGRPPNK